MLFIIITELQVSQSLTIVHKLDVFSRCIFKENSLYVYFKYFQNNNTVHEDEMTHNIERTIYNKLC